MRDAKTEDGLRIIRNVSK